MSKGELMAAKNKGKESPEAQGSPLSPRSQGKFDNLMMRGIDRCVLGVHVGVCR